MAWAGIEAGAYWAVFAIAFLAIATWETLQPLRSLSAPLSRRWSRQGILMVVGAALSAAVFRISPVILAWKLESSRYGVLNKAWAPQWIRGVIAVLILDFVRYAAHWCFHAIPWLWRIHQVHHSDPDFDATTAGRFHPAEVVFTQGANMAAIALLAAPPLAVLILEVAIAFQSFFVHANAALPKWAESLLRRVAITPALHRIHHSADAGDFNCNLGEVLCWWDRLLGTYLSESHAGAAMTTGLNDYRDEKRLGVGFLLMLPFRRTPDRSAAAE